MDSGKFVMSSVSALMQSCQTTIIHQATLDLVRGPYQNLARFKDDETINTKELLFASSQLPLPAEETLPVHGNLGVCAQFHNQPLDLPPPPMVNINIY